MKKLVFTSLVMMTSFVSAWGSCCDSTCHSHREEAPIVHEDETTHKHIACPECRPSREDKSFNSDGAKNYQGCATCSSYGKHERQCGTCGQDTIQARCPNCPKEK